MYSSTLLTFKSKMYGKTPICSVLVEYNYYVVVYPKVSGVKESTYSLFILIMSSGHVVNKIIS